VLSPPDDLPEESLAAALARGWGLEGAEPAYRAVGFGSHHWEIAGRWFVTVDELDVKRHSADEPLEVPYDRLRAALSAAAEVAGLPFVVAPVPAADGEPVLRLGRFAVALYPYLEGESFAWGHYTEANRAALLEMVSALHTAPPPPSARPDDFAIPHRDALAATDPRPDTGPYAQRTADLVSAGAGLIRDRLARYDHLVDTCRTRSRPVLTHGEPHPGNTMRTAAGWRLIDWDTALLAPPERDLWFLEPGSLDAYTAATGVRPDPDTLALYRLRWDLADLAVTVDRFRRPHPGNADDKESWEILRRLLTGQGW
jgi:aminoglycoside phosphotransferase (APT) family kinase protein